jgi:glycerol kinase
MVNGGMTSNRFVLQLMADLLGKAVVNQGIPDVSAQGAAYLAGLKAGIYPNLAFLESINTDRAKVSPGVDRESILAGYAGWQAAIQS